ncbi:MAG: hypothetical protein OXI91_10840 [Chloroflexota bacterium]|nr:hypothetical protein [Chloroflexota bacterium]
MPSALAMLLSDGPVLIVGADLGPSVKAVDSAGRLVTDSPAGFHIPYALPGWAANFRRSRRSRDACPGEVSQGRPWP